MTIHNIYIALKNSFDINFFEIVYYYNNDEFKKTIQLSKLMLSISKTNFKKLKFKNKIKTLIIIIIILIQYSQNDFAKRYTLNITR